MGRSKKSHVRLDTGWACGLQHALPTYSQVPLNVTSIDRFVHSQYVDRQCPPDIVVFDEGRTLEDSWSQLYHCPYRHCTPHKLAPWRVMSFNISWSIFLHISICITEKIIIHLFDNDGRSRSFLERKTFLLVEFVFFDQHCSPVEAWYSWRNLENHCPSYSSRAWTTWHSFQCRQIPAQWKTTRYFKSKYIYILVHSAGCNSRLLLKWCNNTIWFCGTVLNLTSECLHDCSCWWGLVAGGGHVEMLHWMQTIMINRSNSVQVINL